MDFVHRLRSFQNGVYGQFFVNVADYIRSLEQENDILHQQIVKEKVVLKPFYKSRTQYCLKLPRNNS